MALRVASAVDAKTILGYGGPEKLLGKGDMMLKTEKNPEPIRLQGAYVSVEEISSIISFIKRIMNRISLPKLKNVFSVKIRLKTVH